MRMYYSNFNLYNYKFKVGATRYPPSSCITHTLICDAADAFYNMMFINTLMSCNARIFNFLE